MLSKLRFPALGLACAVLAALVPAAAAQAVSRAQAADPPAPEIAAGTPVPLIAGTGTEQTEIPPLVSPGEVGSESATFSITYDASFNANPAAKAAFQFAAGLWGQLLTSPVPITINAEFSPLGTNVLGQSGPDNFIANVAGLPQADTWYPVALANALTGSDQAAGSDATVDMSSNFSSWYYGTDGATPGGSWDFVSVVFHELGHSLGFIGSADVSGNNGSLNLCCPPPSYPAIYDRFVKDGSNTNLTNTGTYPNPGPALKTALTGNAISFVGPSTTGKLYAPNPWKPGSSYSHLDETTYPQGNPNSLMTPVLNNGESIHAPGIALGIFRDMGWPNPAAPVTAPQSVTTVAGSGSAVVSFLPPANDGGSAPTLYTVTASPGGATSTGTRSPVGIAGLTNGTSYTFTVKAANAFGTGPASAPSGAVVPHRFGYAPLPPTRILDTRIGVPAAGNPRSTALNPQQQLTVQVTSFGSVPSDADAVVLNATAVSPTAPGWLTLWDTGTVPLAANLNFAAGQTVANLVTVKLKPGTPPTVIVGNSVGSSSAGFTNVVLDVVGYYADAASPVNTDANDPIQAVTPSRLMDTRVGTGNATVCATCVDPKNTPLGPSATYDVQIAGNNGVPIGATGAVINVTATSPAAGGWLTMYPTGSSPSPPTAANLNFDAGQTIANLVKVKLGTGGKVTVANSFGSPSAGSVHVIFDVVGFYKANATDGGITAVTPARVLDTRGGLVGANTRSTALTPQEQAVVQIGGFGDVPSSGARSVVLNVTAVAPTAAGWLTIWPVGQARPIAATVSFAAGQTIAIEVVVGVGTNGQIQIANTFGNAGAGFANVVVDVAGWYAPGT
jgi:hypothetical protein